MTYSTPELVQELRQLINQKIEAGLPNLDGSSPHPADVERIRDDTWLAKFIEHHEGDIKLALNMMVECLVWRKTNEVSDIGESNINMSYMEEGLFFPRCEDKDGCRVFIFKSKKHSKGSRDSEELKRCVLYWLERLERVEKHTKITMLFDMDGTGLSNMDMDFTKYLINLFKYYYPDFLNYIIVYEMPWVLKAAFNAIKLLMPPKAVAKMQFLGKNDIKNYLPLNTALTCFGGDDDYVYSFISEPIVGNWLSNGVENSGKKVTFTELATPTYENPPMAINGICKLGITPSECIIFSKEGNDTVGKFTIKNNHSENLAYKIKTTSPEKFRVRPSMGTLIPGNSQQISITLHDGYQYTTVNKEKFLVMCKIVTKSEMSTSELTDLWKDSNSAITEQHRLKSNFPNQAILKNGNVASAPSSSDQNQNEINKLKELSEMYSVIRRNQEALDTQLKNMKSIELIHLTLTTIMLCSILYFFLMGQSQAEQDAASNEFCVKP